ncbi:MAG: cupin domain-containing protein, partial [Actinomycetota bacterium]|nr:cupin domain-containing protein [Actinomycetota bacterium]
HWGRTPLLHHAGESAFEGLLGLADVDGLVTETLLRMPSFRLVKDGKPVDPATYTRTIRIGSRPVDRTIRPDRVLDAFADGATIVLQALHRLRGPVGAFCRGLELDLTHPVQANAYVTPASARGFALHHDTHDVFVLQTHGRKRWRVHRPLVELPGREQPWSPAMGAPGPPVIEAELAAGDALYIPRGFLHEAEAQAETSIHVTVGVLALTWLDLWRRVMARAPQHVRFREALPPGFAGDPRLVEDELPARAKELHAWLDEVLEDEAASFTGSFWRKRRPMLAGQMRQLDLAASMDATTAVHRRGGSVFVVAVNDDRATVLLGHRELRMPAFVEPALRFVETATEAFTAADVSGGLDEASRLVLLRRLVREGALEILDDGG